MTDKNWQEMTPEEKRQERYRRWLEPEGVVFDSPEAEKNYKARAKRFIDAFNLEEPDRVPVILPIGAMPANIMGSSYYECSYDYDKAVRIWDEFNAQITDADSLANFGNLVPARAYDLLDLKLYSYPGHGLPKTASGFQFNEGEYMKPEEYDQFTRNPSDFWMRVFMPRIFGLLGPLRDLNSFTTIIETPFLYFAPFANPEMQETLDTLKEVGQELAKYIKLGAELGRKTAAAGYPDIRTVMAKAPFDTIGDTLRGTKGVIMDMRRCPDKLHEALEVVTRFTIDQTLESARRSGVFQIMFPLHKGADGWMSENQFQTFYWPYLRRVIQALNDDGLLVNLFAEGSYETRLDLVNEFPKGAVCWLFDRTDMAKAKKALGDKCCISGNVPTSLIVTGTPDQVKEYSRKLIEDCASGGGFILAGGAKAEKGTIANLRAMLEAAREYGTYNK